jgi:hypothetical protein
MMGGLQDKQELWPNEVQQLLKVRGLYCCPAVCAVMSDDITAGSAVTSGYSACLPARVLLLSHALLLQAIGYTSPKNQQLRCFGWTITLGVNVWYGTHALMRALGDRNLRCINAALILQELEERRQQEGQMPCLYQTTCPGASRW